MSSITENYLEGSATKVWTRRTWYDRAHVNLEYSEDGNYFELCMYFDVGSIVVIGGLWNYSPNVGLLIGSTSNYNWRETCYAINNSGVVCDILLVLIFEVQIDHHRESSESSESSSDSMESFLFLAARALASMAAIMSAESPFADSVGLFWGASVRSGVFRKVVPERMAAISDPCRESSLIGGLSEIASVSTGFRTFGPADLIDSSKAVWVSFETVLADIPTAAGAGGGGGGAGAEVVLREAKAPGLDFGNGGGVFFGTAGLALDAGIEGGGGGADFFFGTAGFFSMSFLLSTKPAMKLAVSLFSNCSCVIPALSNSCFQSSGMFLT